MKPEVNYLKDSLANDVRVISHRTSSIEIYSKNQYIQLK